MKRVLVSLSGGVDSTHLCQMYLRNGYTVDAIYTELTNNENKSLREKTAISEITSHFKSKYGEYFNDLGYNLISLNSTPSSLCFIQVLPWLFTLVNTVKEYHSEVSIGYIQNDDIIPWLPEIQKIWKSFNNISTFKLPPLKFPLIKYNKNSLWDGLDSHLKTLVRWCETDTTNDKCGKCTPCKKMIYHNLMTNLIESDSK